LLSFEHYGNGWKREPGTTEDGVERQKLIITAIIEKQDRVTAEDVRKAWVDHMNPNAAGLVSEPFEGALLAMAKSGIPAATKPNATLDSVLGAIFETATSRTNGSSEMSGCAGKSSGL
jgi:hypothetical protein